MNSFLQVKLLTAHVGEVGVDLNHDLTGSSGAGSRLGEAAVDTVAAQAVLVGLAHLD